MNGFPRNPPVQWKPVESFLKGRQDAAEAIQREEQARANQQLAEAQRQLIEQQTQAQRLENEKRERGAASSGQAPQGPSAAEQEAYQRWIAAALPRVSRFPGFQKVVFAEDVRITSSMVEWMSRSKYAADIAYYLGTHKDEAALMAMQAPDAQAQSLQRIDAEAIQADDK